MKKRNVLLVEDNPNDELLIHRVFKKSRILNDIHVVKDGVSALDYLFCRNQFADRDPNDLPELLLLDIGLPKLDGIEVLHQIRTNHQTRSLPVIILSGGNEEQYLLESYQSGADAYLRKPVNFARICEMLERLGLYLLVVDQLPSC